MRTVSPRGKGPAKRTQWDSAGSRYEVLERVGEGTLFVVYRVRDRSNNRVMALKALKGVFNRHPKFAGTLASCAERTSQLSHPRLAQLWEVGEEEGTLFLVGEWLPGKNLEERLRRAPFGRAEALSFTRQIAEALHYLHQNGAVHGDLRPRHIGSAADGSLKLTDVGYYEAFVAAGLAPMDVLEDSVYYTAPERTEGAPPSPAADLYSLGAVLYRMLAARVPFDGPSPLSIALRHRRDAPLRPSQFNPDCPSDLEEIALRLLQKDPQARYSSAGQLLRDLAVGIPAASTTPTASAASTAGSDDAAFVSNHKSAVDTNGLAAGVATTVAAATAATTGAVASGAAASSAVAPTIAMSAAAIPTAPIASTATSRTAPTTRPKRVAPPPPDYDEDDLNDSGAVSRGGAFSDEELVRRKHRKREAVGALLAVFWLLVALGLFFGIIYGAYFFWEKEKPRVVRVPNYINKSQYEASSILNRHGLKLVVVGQVYDPKRPEGTVIKGQPAPKKMVRTGREIGVTISRGEEPSTMPDLTELTLQRAMQIIERGGMRLGNITNQFDDKIPKGYVFGQYPEPGQSFRRNDPIMLVVSLGSQPSSLPPDPAQLPPPPQRAPAQSTTSDSPVSTASSDTPDVPLVSLTAQVRVAIPADGGTQEVRIVVRDNDGEHTVYSSMHAPGDLINEDVQVTRRQGTTALVRIYVDGTLQREQRV